MGGAPWSAGIKPPIVDRRCLHGGDLIAYPAPCGRCRAASAVGAEAGAIDGTTVPGEHDQLGAGLGVPNPRSVVKRPRNQARTVGAECYAEDGTAVAPEFEQLDARFGVPDPCGIVIGPRDQTCDRSDLPIGSGRDLQGR